MRKRGHEQSQRWLGQAQEDLHWSRHLACFLSQQVAEKAPKAFVYGQGEEIVLGHSVERLCAAAAAYEPEFETRARSWSILDGRYIPTRYPNGLPDGTPAGAYTPRRGEQRCRTGRRSRGPGGGLVGWARDGELNPTPPLLHREERE